MCADICDGAGPMLLARPDLCRPYLHPKISLAMRGRSMDQINRNVYSFVVVKHGKSAIFARRNGRGLLHG